MTDEKRIKEIRARQLAAEQGYLVHDECMAEIDPSDGRCCRCGARPSRHNVACPSDAGFHRESDVAFLLTAFDTERAHAVRAEGERDAWPAPAALPNLDDHPLQDPATANRELRKLLYTVDADRKRSDAKVRELATEVWRLREAMPAMDEVGAARGVLRYVGHSGAHGDICDYADVLSGWLDRIEKARGG